MKLPNYLYIEPQAGMSGAGIIVSTKPPFMFANVWKYKNGEEDRAAALNKIGKFGSIEYWLRRQGQ